MRPYLALFRARFRALLQYRAAAIAGIVTQLAWGLIKTMILQAFYAVDARPQPMSLADAIGYVWLGQAFFHMLPFSTNPDPDVRNMIRTGQVAYELARPIGLHGLWFSRAVAARSAPTIMRALPMFAIAVPLLGMRLPACPSSALAAAAALTGAMLLNGAFSTMITATMLWTTSGEGIARLAPSVVMLGAGLIVPLPLLPDWTQGLLSALPFRSMADDPFRLYLGILPAGAAIRVLGHQAAWACLFIVLGRIMIARGQRRLTLQGG